MQRTVRLANLALVTLTALGAFSTGIQASDGWQVGDEVPSFYVRELTSDRPNLATCLVCRYGARPVVLVCVHRQTADSERVIVAIDRAVDRARGQGLRGFAVFLSTKTDGTPSALLKLSRQGKLSLPLALPIESDGPRELEHPPDANLTVLCYSNRTILSRHTLRGEVTDADVAAILAEVNGLTR
jgi:hypothetical protein